MRITFLRHGESTDDLENRFGGWADFPLTKNGEDESQATAKKLLDSKEKFEVILYSPSTRAVQTAQIVNRALKIPTQSFVYLKERNTYGLLCGEQKEEAAKNYPELSQAFENNEFVLGSERYDDLLLRIKAMLEKIQTLGFKNVLAVTHGKLLAALCKNFLKREAKKLEDNCLLTIELNQNSITILTSEGISFS